MSEQATSSHEHQQQTEAGQQQASSPRSKSGPASSSSSSSSPSNSFSLIKLDELSSFGATKQKRLPALIQLNSELEQHLQQQQANRQPNSMPTLSASQLELSSQQQHQQQQQQLQQPATSLPVDAMQLDHQSSSSSSSNKGGAEKENRREPSQAGDDDEAAVDLSDEFQVVDMVPADLMGPSLPQPQQQQPKSAGDAELLEQRASAILRASNQQQQQQHPSHLGDSLIDMIVNLRNENQNLVRALETNNEYVKERLNEFKRANEESKRREAQFALEKAENEHQVRKLQRQNMVLSERLKSMEAKLKDMKLEVSDALVAANSSKTSSVREAGEQPQLYPNLAADQEESFANSALLNQTTTMQMDAASGELYNNNDNESSHAGSQPAMDLDPASAGPSGAEAVARNVGAMSKEELSKRFDADKTAFYAMDGDDDPMKQCDKLEQQLNDIGKRDYEICLLQQQLNIYRQDFRLERMANLEAKIQIEKLKNDIDRLCFERLQEKTRGDDHDDDDHNTRPKHHLHRGSHHRASGGVRFDTAQAAEAVIGIGKLGHQLSKKAAKSAAKAAKYASKQAHREEKAAAATAAAAAAAADQASSGMGAAGQPTGAEHYGGHRRHHSYHHRHRGGVRSEVVNDLLSTANKAMLTGYKMASTHVNLALDKLSQYEQAQANNLARQAAAGGAAACGSTPKPSAPMQPPSMD